jgi:DNA-binding response OmpR family regulator
MEYVAGSFKRRKADKRQMQSIQWEEKVMQRVFLIEDDNAIAKNLTLLLRSEGFAVTHAATQKQALSALDEGKFDLALIDISLPDGNGFSVCTAIKAEADIPIIFLTASADEVSVVTGLNMGANDYITKPFRPMELIARIKAALRKSGHAPSTFEIGSLHIDTAGGNVHKNGREIFLSALEYRLLLVFLNNQKAIITRNKLLDELWDAAGEYVNDNTLTVYIKRLREKIENDPANPEIILTVRGMGYKLGGQNASE